MVAAQHRRSSIWQNRDFTLFWLGETVSLAGTQITFIALPLTAVLTLDAGTTQVGVLRFAEYLPFLLCTLAFGVWADRVRRRPLMIASNAVRGALVALVPALAVLGLLRLPILVVIAFAIGTCAALFEVCWLTYVPGLVDRDRVVEAMGKVSTSHSAAEVAGPGLGGALVQVLTPPFALVVDAVSYVVSTVALTAIRHRESSPGGRERPDRHALRELTEGIHFAFGEPCIRATAYAAALANFFAIILETVFLVYAVRELGLSAGLLGLALSALGVGGLLGASLANTMTRLFPVGRLFVTARILGGLSLFLVPSASGSTTSVVLMCTAGFFVWQAALANTNVIATSLRYTLTPEHLRGRTNASVRTLIFGVFPLGGLAGGVLGTVIGMRGALWVGAVGYLLSVLPVLFSPLPGMTRIPSRP